MGKAGYNYKEVRFVFEEELTQCYVSLDATGDAPMGVQGWHHKTFPVSKSAIDILKGFAEEDDPVMWAQDYPK